jgi:TonB family protein
VVTAMVDFDPTKMPVPELPTRYLPRKVQFHMFVSPFTEPARVYLGSILQVEDRFASDLTAYLYGVPVLEDWLFGRLEGVLGQTGRAMPATHKGREALAQSLDGSASRTGCAGLAGSVPAGAQIKEPQPIKITHVQPVYPGKGEYAGGVVKVEATLLEDGSIVEARALENTGPSAQFAQAAVEAVRLWRYRPTRVGDCPVPTIMNVKVNFRPR